MRPRRLEVIGILLLLLFVSTSAGAQVPISIGARTGESRTLSGARSGGRGWSVDLVGAYRINPTISAYLMSGGTGLGSHKEDASLDLSLYSTSVGMTMLMGPLGVGRPAPWVGGGIGLYSLAVSRNLTDLDEQSRTRVGFDLAGGVAVALSPQIHITPAIRFAMFEPKFSFEEIVGGDQIVTRSVGWVSYVTFDVGIMYNFGVRGRR